MRDAIKHIEPLASVDEARLTTCFLAPAVRALPNRFEHHGDDAARARDVFGVGATIAVLGGRIFGLGAGPEVLNV